MGNEIEIVSNNAVQQTESKLAANDIIKLPEGKKIDTRSDEFFAVSVEVLPDNVKNEVKDLAKNQNVKYTRFEIFLYSLITFAIFAAAIFWLLPAKPKVIKITDDFLVPEALILPKPSKPGMFSAEKTLLDNMKKAYDDKRYLECLNLLPEKELNNILSDNDKFCLNAESINYLLHAVKRGNPPPGEKKTYVEWAVRLSRQLTELNPDSPAWHLHRLYFENYDIVANDSFEKIPVGKKHKNGTELDRLQRQTEYLENIKNAQWEKNLRIKFDLLKSKIYIACWLHYLSYDNSHIRKEKNSNGFREREAAWKTINQYSENNLKFLDLKEFILRKIKSLDTWHSGYEINNIKYYRAKHLDEMLEEVAETRKILNKAANKKGL